MNNGGYKTMEYRDFLRIKRIQNSADCLPIADSKESFNVYISFIFAPYTVAEKRVYQAAKRAKLTK